MQKIYYNYGMTSKEVEITEIIAIEASGVETPELAEAKDKEMTEEDKAKIFNEVIRHENNG